MRTVASRQHHDIMMLLQEMKVATNARTVLKRVLHEIPQGRDVSALPGMRLSVQFANGTAKTHDVASLTRLLPAFAALEDEVLFGNAEVYGIVWNDELDLFCDELWNIGSEMATLFDDLMSFSDVSESTLRKVITYGKIVSGVDARKYGKQWVVNLDAMSREYGDPVGE